MATIRLYHTQVYDKENKIYKKELLKVGGQAVLGRQLIDSTPWLTERHGYDPTLYALLCYLSYL